MRFVRNQKLKEHLNQHFERNYALKRKADQTNSRCPFQTIDDFVTPAKQKLNQDGKLIFSANFLKGNSMEATEASATQTRWSSTTEANLTKQATISATSAKSDLMLSRTIKTKVGTLLAPNRYACPKQILTRSYLRQWSFTPTA